MSFFLHFARRGDKAIRKVGALAVVILCCVHGEVAGKNRGKYVKKGRTRATQDIRDDHRSMFMADSGV